MKRIWIGILAGMCVLSGCGPLASSPVTQPEDTSRATTAVTTTAAFLTTEKSGTTETSVKSSDFTEQTLQQGIESGLSFSSGAGSETKLSQTTPKTTRLESHTQSSATQTTETTGHKNETEFRGVWVSYIELQDLLHKNNTPEKAKKAIDALMDDCVSLRLTAVIWMVRGHSDAYYNSKIFKANAYAAPLLAAGFDPLAYAVSAAHKRGLELHAWVNPYRIGSDIRYAVCEDSFYYGGTYYYIPTSENVARVVLNGLKELVAQYKIDGLHFDDYFYPEGCASETEAASFETKAYAAYCKKVGSAAKHPGEWRRNAVNDLVRAAYEIAHSRKGCVFGVSPSHDYKKTYGQMYADSKLWLAKAGYVDYLCPQVYVGFENGVSPFNTMVDTWLSYPKSNRVELYFGLGLYKIGLSPDRYAQTPAGQSEWTDHSDIMKRSVLYLRSKSACGGMAFYSYTYFNPATYRSVSMWTENGITVKQTYQKAVAEREITALKQALA